MDELGARLDNAVRSETEEPDPDLGWVMTRGRKLRLVRAVPAAVFTFGVVAVLAWGSSASWFETDDPPVVAGPSSGRHTSQPEQGRPLVESTSERERAEIFAFRAVAAADLMGPFHERSYGFTHAVDTTSNEGTWRVGFASLDCAPRAGAFTCRGLSGEDDDTGNPVTDTFLLVARAGDRWEVVDVEGNMPREERERVIGYSLPDRDEPSHWEFPVVDIWAEATERSVAMIPIWVGPYPTEAPGSVCTLRYEDAEGEKVGEESVFYQESPTRPFDRAGWHRTTGGPKIPVAAAAEVGCRQYTGPGWEVTGAPEVARVAEGIVGISARLTWRGAEGFTSAALCRATLVDDAGNEVWAGTGRAQPLWRTEELSGYPYRTTVMVTTGGEPVAAEGIGEFTCRSW